LMYLVKDRISAITLVNELERLIRENGVKSVLVDFEKKTPGFVALLSLGGKDRSNDEPEIYFTLSDGELIKRDFEDQSLEYYVVKDATWVIYGVVFTQHGKEEGTMHITIGGSGKARRMLENAISELARKRHVDINITY